KSPRGVDPARHAAPGVLASWGADVVRDDVRGCVVEHFYDEAAVLVVDEAGDLKKGTHSVGVQRQCTGRAGRIENSQVAVYLVYAGERGHAAVDRELYLRAPGRARSASRRVQSHARKAPPVRHGGSRRAGPV